VPGPGNALQAPHIALGIVGPGFLKRLATRIYLPECRAENAEDPILGLVPEERRSTLIATKEPAENLYRFDIRLGGERETVFFDI
jgi:protocatechuate 3,4-dioxygenase alpha subunit